MQTHWGQVADTLVHTCPPQSINTVSGLQSASKLGWPWWTRKFISLNILFKVLLQSKADPFIVSTTIVYAFSGFGFSSSQRSHHFWQCHSLCMKLYRQSEVPLERTYFRSDRQGDKHNHRALNIIRDWDDSKQHSSSREGQATSGSPLPLNRALMKTRGAYQGSSSSAGSEHWFLPRQAEEPVWCPHHLLRWQGLHRKKWCQMPGLPVYLFLDLGSANPFCHVALLCLQTDFLFFLKKIWFIN